MNVTRRRRSSSVDRQVLLLNAGMNPRIPMRNLVLIPILMVHLTIAVPLSTSLIRSNFEQDKICPVSVAVTLLIIGVSVRSQQLSKR